MPASAADLSWLKRFEGSFIVNQQRASFDGVVFPLSKLVNSDECKSRDDRNNCVFDAKRRTTAEGKVTRTLYVLPEDVTPLVGVTRA